MEWKDGIYIIVFLLQIVAMVVSVTRVVGRVESTTALLQQALEHLRESIDHARLSNEHLATIQAEQGNRLVKVETRLEETSKHRRVGRG